MVAPFGVPQVLGDHPLGTVDTALSEAPFHLGQLELGCRRFCELALVVQVEDLDTGLVIGWLVGWLAP